MNPKIEVIESKLRGGSDLEEFRLKLGKFAEAHKVINVSTTMDTQGLVIYATILYEEVDRVSPT
jgi:hypothetical protein